MTTARSIVDSSLLSELTIRKVEIPTKANVKAPKFPMLPNMLYATDMIPATAMNAIITTARCMERLPMDITAPVLPMAAASAATTGRIKTCVYPSFSIAPFAA